MNNQAMEVTEYRADDFEHVVLETEPARVLQFPNRESFEWLMRDSLSTDYATVIRA